MRDLTSVQDLRDLEGDLLATFPENTGPIAHAPVYEPIIGAVGKQRILKKSRPILPLFVKSLSYFSKCFKTGNSELSV